MDATSDIEFWFDFSCPYAYLASTQRHRLAAETGRTVRLEPFLLGGVFHAIGQVQNLSAILSPPKARHNRNDVVRWATWFDVPLRSPPKHPNRTVDALRALIAAPPHAWQPLVDAFYAAYWAEQRDLADRAVIVECLAACQLDAEAIWVQAQSSAVKDELRDRTARAVERGVFGAPAFIVDGELFWGQDRLPLVAAAAKGWRARPELADFRF